MALSFLSPVPEINPLIYIYAVILKKNRNYLPKPCLSSVRCPFLCFLHKNILVVSMLPSLPLLPFSFEPLSEVFASHQHSICEKFPDSQIQQSIFACPSRGILHSKVLSRRRLSQFLHKSTATFFLAPLLGYFPCPGCPGLSSGLIKSYESIHHLCSDDPTFIYSTAFSPWIIDSYNCLVHSSSKQTS